MNRSRYLSIAGISAGVLAGVGVLCFVITRLTGSGAAPIVQDVAAIPAAAPITTQIQTDPVQQTQPAKTEQLPDDWRLILVNKEHAVPEAYDVTLLKLSNGNQVDERIYPDLQAMFDAARAEGVNPTVSQGFRTEAEQQTALEEKKQEFLDAGKEEAEAEALAAEYAAQPGYSEHQLGLALDINAAPGGGSDNETVYAWLAENAWDYGFILRYPAEKEDMTGIAYEPWHYRYVGKDAAKEMKASGECLEEYLMN